MKSLFHSRENSRRHEAAFDTSNEESDVDSMKKRRRSDAAGDTASTREDDGQVEYGGGDDGNSSSPEAKARELARLRGILRSLKEGSRGLGGER